MLLRTSALKRLLLRKQTFSQSEITPEDSIYCVKELHYLETSARLDRRARQAASHFTTDDEYDKCTTGIDRFHVEAAATLEMATDCLSSYFTQQHSVRSHHAVQCAPSYTLYKRAVFDRLPHSPVRRLLSCRRLLGVPSVNAAF